MVVWQSDVLSVVGLGLEVAVGMAYVLGARRARHRRTWPRSNVAMFLAGLVALAVVLQSGVAAYDETYTVHVVQHVVLMSVAPMLLALGAPVTLLLRISPTPVARRVVAFLHSRPARVMCGPRAAMHVPLEFYGLMFVFLLAPVQRLTARSELLHVPSHLLLLTCGLIFWVPMLGRDPAPWRPSERTRLAAAAAGLPASALLAAAAASWQLLVVGEAAALIGMVAVRFRTRGPSRRRPAQPMRPMAASSAVQA